MDVNQGAKLYKTGRLFFSYLELGLLAGFNYRFTPISIDTFITDKSKRLFTIQQISLKLDIPKSTLRFWEKELDGFILPIRTSGGQRRYGLEDFSIISKVKEFRTRNINLTEIKSHLQTESPGVVAHPQLGNIDLLIERVGKVIKAEVFNFLSSHTTSDVDDHHASPEKYRCRQILAALPSK